MGAKGKQESEKADRSARPRATIPAGVDALMDAATVADALGISKREFYRMVSAGEFPAAGVRIGRLARWPTSCFNDWVKSQCSKPKPKG